MNIKVLDCTLRDGGYINSWNFGYDNIVSIIKNLNEANIDYIECGFYKRTCPEDKNKSLFCSFESLHSIVQNFKNSKYALMINYGEIPIEEIPECKYKNIAIRVVFKKDKSSEALKYCAQLKEKGYEIFINPMSTINYTAKELIVILSKVNEIAPRGFTIVDTNGSMKKQDILSLFYLIDNNLNKDIYLCFHSHNNLQLSFSNAQVLLEQKTDRTIVIDSTVFGMGRGAGNLCSELLTQYINDNYNGNYNIIPILKTIDECINPIFSLTPWGYSVPYYLAATNLCHPNYALYLVNKETVPIEIINEILKNIPVEKRSIYDENLIKQIYIDYQDKKIDDLDTINKLKNIFKNKKILILAPGKTLNSEKRLIEDFIKKEKPFILSLNFIPTDYKPNIAFISNLKRFKSIRDINTDTIITSNITEEFKNCFKISYSKYLNDSKVYDNVALMCFKFLQWGGVCKIYVAGLDGFSKNQTDNYCEQNMAHTKPIDTDEYNAAMANAIRKFKETMEINFLTKTLYDI